MSHGYRLPLRMAVEATVIRMPAPATLIVATWNIHGGIGIDGRYSSARIVEVLNELDADIVALQEVASPEAHENFLHEIERETGYHVAAGLLRQRVGSDFGNAVLSRYAFSEISRLDLAVRDYEPRGALDVCITVSTRQVLRVIGTHLGLRPRERREQVHRLIGAIERQVPHPTVLMGDLNEWYLWGRPLRWLHTHFREVPTAPRTFPSWRPMFALDRIWVSPAGRLRRLARHASPLARMASDHLPLKAEIVV